MYKDLRLYDWEGNFLCNVSQWKSLDWQLMYNSVGTFEGHFSPESKVVDAVLTHPRLIAVQGDRHRVPRRPGRFCGLWP